MLKFKYMIWALALISVVMAGGVAQASNIPTTTQTMAQAELDATFTWPEAGLRFEYPSDWQQINDAQADFVLLAPLEGESFVYMAMQSGLYDPTSESVLEIMTSFVDNPNDLVEFTAGESTAYQFTDTSEDITSIFVGFTSDAVKIHLLNLSVSNDVVDQWLPVLQDIVASMVVEPLELDADILNTQMQANFEATGRLIIGELDAPAQVYEFLDFACPHCVDYHDELNRLVQDQVLPGNTNLQFGLLTFVAGDLSVNAATAQVCATQLGIGWDVHNLLFNTYRFDGRTAYEVPSIVENVAAADLGVDMGEFEACMEDGSAAEAYLELVSSDAQNYGVNSTPTVLFADAEGDFDLMTLPTNQQVARANLNITYAYIASLAE